jgi:Tfp pilus assembly protein PilN
MQQIMASHKIRFTISLIRCVGLTVFALFVWHVTLYDLVIYQEESNALLKSFISKKKSEIVVFEKRQRKLVESEARLKFIAELSQQNKQVGQLLEELQKVTPLTVTLTQLIRQGKELIVDGNVHSDLDLIQWMENINKSTLFMDPAVGAMTKKDDIRYFQLRIGIKP